MSKQCQNSVWYYDYIYCIRWSLNEIKLCNRYSNIGIKRSKWNLSQMSHNYIHGLEFLTPKLWIRHRFYTRIVAIQMNQNCREPGSATIRRNFSSKLYWWQPLWYITIFSPEHKQTFFLYPLYNSILIHQSLTSAIIYIVVSAVLQMSSTDESDSLSRQIQRHLSSASEMFNHNNILVSTAKLL